MKLLKLKYSKVIDIYHVIKKNKFFKVWHVFAIIYSAIIRMRLYSFECKINKKCSVIVIDQGLSGIEKALSDSELFNYNNINILYAALSFPWKNGIKSSYISRVIRSYSPKIIIFHNLSNVSMIDDNTWNRSITICYQGCMMWVDRLDYYGTIRKCNYYMTYNDFYESHLKETINAEFVVTGSVRANNKISCDHRLIRKEFDILFVSEFNENYVGTKENKSPCYERTRFLYDLNNYVLSKNLKATVAMNMFRVEKEKYCLLENEKKYYNKCFYCATEQLESSYDLAMKSRVIVVFNSSLGLELLSFGMKVLFVLLDKSVSISADAGHIGGADNIMTIRSYDEVNSKLDFILNMEQESFVEYYQQNYPWLLSADCDNSILRKMVRDLTK